MPTGYGHKSILGIAFQNSGYVAADVSSLDFLPFLNESVSVAQPDLVSEDITGIFDEGDSETGAASIAGDINAEVTPIPLGLLLTAAMGAPVTTQVVTGSVYQHVFTPQNTDWDDYFALQPFTLYKHHDVNSAELMYDLCGSQLEMSVANGEFLKAKLAVVGGRQEFAGEQVATLPTGRRWTWDVTSTEIGSGSGYAGVGNNLRDLTVTLDNALEAKHALNGSKWPIEVKRGTRMVNIAGTMVFRTMAEKQAFLEKSERPLRVTCTGKSEIHSGYFDTGMIVIPKVRYEEFPNQAAGKQQLEVGFSMKGKYHTGSGTAFQFTLQNTRATYP